ncbi:TonB-dependent receptor [Acetobacter senegalensis]|uniref:TonB-dependent receptor n=1 Tax=Acetobacter senegalensis TaxID=446692 RepID=UPI0020101CD2|nr:TonB-dependent receptor [Acetobacter senegalensis]
MMRGVFAEKQNPMLPVKLRILLLSSIAALYVSGVALAEDAKPVGKVAVRGKVAVSGAHNVKKSNKAAVSRHSEEVEVAGSQRYMQTGSSMKVDSRILQSEVPGQNILKSLGQLPGTSYSSSDPLGIDGWSSSIHVRGFSQNQLGVTLDGIPLNDQTYANLNGLNINNAAISDDIGRASMSVGAGGLAVPSNSNLGGSMEMSIKDPSDKMGAKVSQGFGSYGMKRTYVRLDSGKLNHSGTKFFVSYARAYEKKYNSSSPDFMQNVDAKIMQPLGERVRAALFFNWSNAEVWNYSDNSLEMLDKLGWRTANFYPNYAGAYAAGLWGMTDGAQGSLPAGWQNVSTTYGTAFYDAGQATVDYLTGLHLDADIMDRLKWHGLLYGHKDDTHTVVGDPYDYSTTGAPLAEDVWHLQQQRGGFTTSFTYDYKKHHFETGAWFENNRQETSFNIYNQPLLGQGTPVSVTGPYDRYGLLYSAYHYKWNTNTFQYHLMDTYTPFDNLRLTYGFKSMLQTTSGGAQAGFSNLAHGSMTSSAAFLPNVNLVWRFLPHHELYFDVAETMRPYSVAAKGSYTSPWGVSTQALFNENRSKLKPEKDWVYVVGYRYTSRKIVASIAGYHADISHRLMSASVGSINNPVSTVIDTRKASMYGVDASINYYPFKWLGIFNSISYNHMTYGAHVNACPLTGNCDMYGKKMVAYPSFIYKTGIDFHYHGFNANFYANYFSKRYYSLMNDTSVSPYWFTSAGASYDFGRVSVLKNVKVNFTVYNLLNQKYISMMGENGFPVSGDYQSLQRGAVREFFGTVSASF